MQHCAEFFATLSAQKCKENCSSSQARIIGDLQCAMKLQCKFQNSISKTPESVRSLLMRTFYEKLNVVSQGYNARHSGIKQDARTQH